MLSTRCVDHVMTHIAQDLCVRYPEVACERIEAMVETHRAALETDNQHPEFLGALVEHAVKDELHALAGTPEPATGVTC